MTSRNLSAGQLRYHLQELSVSVARRLVAVLEVARNAPHGVAAELDAVVSEITNVQRDIAYEMAGPPLGGTSDLASLSRMLDLQQRMMTLIDRLETLSKRPITTYLDQRQQASAEARRDWVPVSAPLEPQPQRSNLIPAARTWEEPHHAYAPPQSHEVLPQHAAYDSHAAGAAPFLARAAHTAQGSLGASGAIKWPHMSPAARWGLLPMAICIVSALLTTTVNQLLRSDPPGILTHSDSVAKRGDRLDTPGGEESKASSARPSTRLEPSEQSAALQSAAVQPSVITVSPPPPPSDRGLDALNPDAPSVAVVATHQDSQVARQMFLKLKERFPDILGSSEAELEAITAQDGATWHRVSLIPPVPRAEAKDLCKRLRAGGYAGCWVRSRPTGAE